MITLSKGGAYLLNGNEVIEVGDDSEEILKSKLGQNYLTKEEAAKNTMAYNILNSIIHLETWKNSRLNLIN